MKHPLARVRGGAVLRDVLPMRHCLLWRVCKSRAMDIPALGLCANCGGGRGRLRMKPQASMKHPLARVGAVRSYVSVLPVCHYLLWQIRNGQPHGAAHNANLVEATLPKTPGRAVSSGLSNRAWVYQRCAPAIASPALSPDRPWLSPPSRNRSAVVKSGRNRAQCS